MKYYSRELVQKWFFIVIIPVTITAILFGFKFNFPIPWEDESSFLFQSIGFYNTNSLFSEALSQERIIMWMPPGYMVFVGLIYKIFGYSFELSRHISWFAYIGAYLIFTLTVKHQIGWISAAAIALAFFYPAGLAIANTARMDVFVLLLYVIILFTLMQGRFILSMGVTIIGLLFHPNMAYVVIPAGVTLAYTLFVDKEDLHSLICKQKMIDGFFLMIAILFVFTYLLFVINNYHSFLSDMAFQFHRKFSRQPFYYSRKNNIFFLLGITISVFHFLNRNRFLLTLSVFGISFFLIGANGQEMWYDFFSHLVYPIFAISIYFITNKLSIRYATTILFAMVSLKLFASGFAGMSPYSTIYTEDYVNKATIGKIEKVILDYKKQSGRDSLSITFFSKGVDLFFIEFANKNNIRIIHKLPNEIEAMRPVDIAVQLTRPQDPEGLSLYHQPSWGSEKIRLISTKNDDLTIIKTPE